MNSNKNFNIPDYLKKKSVKRFSLFFTIAFIFLIFSKLSNDYKQTIKLKVNLVNIEDEIILDNDSVNTIDAYIEAKGFSLIPLVFKNSIDIVLDGKTDVISKSNQFIFDVQKHQFIIEEQLGKSYKVLSLMSDTLVLSYSKRASKFVPITLNSAIDYTIGYDIKGDFNFNVDSVKVVGSASEVNKISALATEKLVLKGVNTNIKASVKLNVSEYKNIDVFPKFVNVTGEITRFTEGTIEIPISITNKPNKTTINFFPKMVTIAYYVDLDNYNTIKATDFIVECDYSNIKDNQTYFVPEIKKKPTFVKRLTIKQKRIDFIKL